MASSTKSGRVPAPNFLCCRVCNMWCWKIFKWLPVLLITSILAWSYYAYVIELCIKTIESTVEKTFNLIIYHFLLVMFVSSYWQTVFAEIPPIPDRFKLPEDELERLLSAESEEAQRLILENFAKDLPVYTRVLTRVKLAIHMAGAQSENKKEILERVGNKLNVLTRTASGSVRYCNRCMLVKPDRAHHCSICARCIPKMDHHCPWVNNCVCYHNYKFFILFLSYALMYCLFVMLTCLPYFIKFWKGEFGISNDPGRYHILFAFFVALMFAISLGSLLGYHIYLVMHNRTTLEAFRAPMFRAGQDKNGFSLGCYNNFKEVFGNKPNKWFIPVFTSLGDGCDWPVRREHQLQTFTTSQEPHGYESMGTTVGTGLGGTTVGTTRSRSDSVSGPSADARYIP